MYIVHVYIMHYVTYAGLYAIVLHCVQFGILSVILVQCVYFVVIFPMDKLRLLLCGSCKRPPQIQGLSLPRLSPFEIGLGRALPRWVQKGCSRPLLTPRLSQ